MHKNFLNFWNRRRERFYRKHKWQLVLDFSLIAIIIILIGLFVQLVSFEPILRNFISWPIASSSPGTSDSKNLDFEIKAVSVKQVIASDEDIVLSLEFENKGEKDIKEAYLKPELITSSHSLRSVESDREEVEVKDNQLIVRNLVAGESLSLKLILKWQKNYPEAPRVIESKLNTLAIAQDGSRVEKILELEEHKIMANIELEAKLFYHSPQGDQLGIGPIPPVVDIPTKYWLIVKADNQGSEINNFVFTAELAEEVEFSDEYSLMAGKFSYDKNRRLLIWSIPNMKVSDNDHLANFALTLNPIAEQVGKNAIMLKNIKYHADDPLTGKEIGLSLNNLDNSLPYDRINKGQGVVTND